MFYVRRLAEAAMSVRSRDAGCEEDSFFVVSQLSGSRERSGNFGSLRPSFYHKYNLPLLNNPNETAAPKAILGVGVFSNALLGTKR